MKNQLPITVILLLIIGCKVQSKKISQQILSDDFVMVTAPTSQIKPGYIFAEDKTGKKYPISTVDVRIQLDSIKLGTLEIVKNIKGSALLNFVNITSEVNGLNLRDTLFRNISIVPERAIKCSILLADNGKNIREKKEEIIKNIFDMNLYKMKMYLVVETIGAQKIKMKFSDVNNINQSFKLAISSKSSTSQSVDWNSNRELQLQYNTNDFLTIFYKTYSLVLKRNLNGKYDLEIDNHN